MNTYLVRTQADQTLMGIFVAVSLADLANIIDEVFDASECEYLALGANEGLFVEAKFEHIPGRNANAPGEVVLISVDDLPLDALVELEEGADLGELDCLDEHIPPVLEASKQLHAHLQDAFKQCAWRPVVAARKTKSAEPTAVAAAAARPVNADSIARRLMEGALSPAFFHPRASSRQH